jgi:hypothetical protein
VRGRRESTPEPPPIKYHMPTPYERRLNVLLACYNRQLFAYATLTASPAVAEGSSQLKGRVCRVGFAPG